MSFHKPVFISDASPKTSAALAAVSLALSSTVTDPRAVLQVPRSNQTVPLASSLIH